MRKETLQTQIAQGNIKQTLNQLIRWTKTIEDDELEHDLMILSNDYKAYEKAERNGTHSKIDLRQMRNLVISNLIGLVEDLPENGESIEKSRPTFTIGRLKGIIAILLLIGKLFLIMSLDFHRVTGGLPPDEFIATLGFLTPVFVAYLSAILIDFFKHSNHRKNRQPATSAMVWSTMLVIPIYVFAFWSILQWRALGEVDADQMNTLMTVIESGLGAFVGIIVFELFRRA